MRYKVVPAVRDVAFLRSVAGTLPLVPGSVEDCCTRIRDGTAVPSRDDARTWLTFVQALGLAAETARGYHRVRDEPSPEEMATAFRENVFGAREALEALADGSAPATEVFEAVRPVVPAWERNRHADWEAAWQTRVERLLGWAVVFDLVTETDGRYERQKA